MACAYEKPVFRIAGDRGLMVEYGDAIDPAIHRKVRAISLAIGREPPHGLMEVIPAYRSVTIIYNPAETDPGSLKEHILVLDEGLSMLELLPPPTVEIPVCYGGEFGPDIGFVAAVHNLTEEEVIRLHSQSAYLIYMLGFTPGFPYMGGLPEALRTPRLETPRTFVPAGSVGIADSQTGVYSVDSPGGWRLIGRTPLKVFDAQRHNPFLFKAGDLLKFRPISKEEYQRVEERGTRIKDKGQRRKDQGPMTNQ